MTHETQALITHIESDEGLYNLVSEIVSAHDSLHTLASELRDLVGDWYDMVFVTDAANYALRQMVRDIGSERHIDFLAVAEHFYDNAE